MVWTEGPLEETGLTVMTGSRWLGSMSGHLHLPSPIVTKFMTEAAAACERGARTVCPLRASGEVRAYDGAGRQTYPSLPVPSMKWLLQLGLVQCLQHVARRVCTY